MPKDPSSSPTSLFSVHILSAGGVDLLEARRNVALRFALVAALACTATSEESPLVHPHAFNKEKDFEF
jgi:hypothetical protein